MTTSPASSVSDELFARVGANLARVRERVRSTGRDPSSVRVLAVTKTFGADAVAAAYALGLHDVGENYVDELCAKRELVANPAITWHYLGALQSNKIARALSCAQVLSGVARVKEVDKIAALAPGASIDVQVDFTGAGERNGAPPAQVGALVERARALGLHVRGLMVVAPHGDALTRAAFARTGALADEFGVRERSMGMSDDLELACEMGSTEVRLGRALFGSRPSRGDLA